MLLAASWLKGRKICKW